MFYGIIKNTHLIQWDIITNQNPSTTNNNTILIPNKNNLDEYGIKFSSRKIKPRYRDIALSKYWVILHVQLLILALLKNSVVAFWQFWNWPTWNKINHHNAITINKYQYSNQYQKNLDQNMWSIKTRQQCWRRNTK